jgi:glycosyltransferase involved in cell wall biosynthesis
MLKIVCIPAFNEENSIYDIIKRSLKFVDRVIVCDDGSSDLTSEKAKEAGATVLTHKTNLGKGSAFKTLFEYANEIDADIIVTIDGDGQFLPEEMENMITSLQKSKADIVIGNRYANQTEMPSYRKAGNKILDKFTKLAADLPFEDTQSGYRVYSKNAISSIKITNQGFGVDSEILVDAANKRLKIIEEPVTVLYNLGHKTSTKDPITHSVGVMSSLIELIAINHPLRFLGIPGFILIIIGIIFSIIVLTIFNDSRIFSIPSTLTALGSLIIGIILLLMSVVLYSIAKISKKIS